MQGPRVWRARARPWRGSTHGGRGLQSGPGFGAAGFSGLACRKPSFSRLLSSLLPDGVRPEEPAARMLVEGKQNQVRGSAFCHRPGQPPRQAFTLEAACWAQHPCYRQEPEAQAAQETLRDQALHSTSSAFNHLT